ncbi:MAG: hypothetical protein RJQ08_11545 [Salinisphaeraceae bacterium]
MSAIKHILWITLAASVSGTAISQEPTSSVGDGNEEERSDLERLPDVLECNKFSWMENCEVLNRQAKRNPAAPIRARASDGTEYTFAPDTPSTVITHMLNPTSESASAMVARERRMRERDELAARLARIAIKQQYGEFGFGDFDGPGGEPLSVQEVQAQNAKNEASSLKNVRASQSIDYESVRVFVFYDSDCAYCRRSMPEWIQLKNAHPGLDLRLLQMNEDDRYLQLVRNEYELPAVPLTGAKREDILRRVETTPTVWIEDKSSKRTRVLSGYQSMSNLEREIAQVSQK